MRYNKTDLPEICGFIETSLLDWDGSVSSVIFLPMCNFDCLYCHNYTITNYYNKINSVKVSYIFNYLQNFKKWIDGVVISGGEPTVHCKYKLRNLLLKIKELGFKIKLDTNGYNCDTLIYLIKFNLLDMVSIDLKAPLNSKLYNKIVQKEINLNKIKKSLKIFPT